MQATARGATHIIRLDKGENVIETLTSYCEREHITNASVSGIGAVEHVSCGYYSLAEKKYYFTEYDELLEVVSLSGNVTLKEERPMLHLHGVFTDTNNTAFGGHIREMRVGVVLEVLLTPLEGDVTRTFDENIGLHLMDCS